MQQRVLQPQTCAACNPTSRRSTLKPAAAACRKKWVSPGGGSRPARPDSAKAGRLTSLGNQAHLKPSRPSSAPQKGFSKGLLEALSDVLASTRDNDASASKSEATKSEAARVSPTGTDTAAVAAAGASEEVASAMRTVSLAGFQPITVAHFVLLPLWFDGGCGTAMREML